eukprot:7853262-Heterocapsa_arctica.AAC.1
MVACFRVFSHGQSGTQYPIPPWKVVRFRAFVAVMVSAAPSILSNPERSCAWSCRLASLTRSVWGLLMRHTEARVG